MKLLHYNMYQKLKYTLAACLLTISVAVNAQITVQSPYSKFGVGNVKGSLLPQFRAMGGISTAVSKNSFFNNINMQNPASYAGINAVTLDIGMNGTYNELRNSTITENSFNATLSHAAFGFNLGRKSGLSFGILPYSELGYNFKNTTKVGDKDVDFLYTGEGGLTKAYLGYGFGLGDHLKIGANLEYLFGNLSENRSTQYSTDPGAINSSIQDRNSVGGVNYSYGAQYDIRIDNKTSFVIGYSGSAASKIGSTKSKYVTQYTLDANGDPNPAADTLFVTENGKTNLKLPLVHNFGVTLQKADNWLIGADYRMGNWSNLSIDNVNQNLQDTYGFSVGGQITPDFSSINNYFKRVEYRLGFSYDKTYIQMNNQDVKQIAVTMGLGLPLSSYARGAVYKANLAAEFGKRGSLANGLLQERYVTFHLGFTLNDSSWFRRFKFD
ncbi:outer membrane protein transport protein [Pedobacter insulae]|uniref:Long-chain fatty acid transport protein n=1 Tax=Pedobacter insulae TaxID=414048 RepID=A0A1I2T9I5_9SPHI|nr:outer membrane protein transport protein [Pedobacter insulae]SFG61684.1 Long-chain fatty acid transport protein [Pedobacter insulae]